MDNVSNSQPEVNHEQAASDAVPFPSWPFSGRPAGVTDFITILRSSQGKRLTKRVYRDNDGKLAVQDYDGATFYQMRQEPIATLADLARVITSLRRDEHAVHGQLI